jgi:hypothetical protein
MRQPGRILMLGSRSRPEIARLRLPLRLGHAQLHSCLPLDRPCTIN